MWLRATLRRKKQEGKFQTASRRIFVLVLANIWWYPSSNSRGHGLESEIYLNGDYFVRRDVKNEIYLPVPFLGASLNTLHLPSFYPSQGFRLYGKPSRYLDLDRAGHHEIPIHFQPHINIEAKTKRQEKEKENPKKRLTLSPHTPPKPRNKCNPIPPHHGEDCSAKWNLPEAVIFIA